MISIFKSIEDSKAAKELAIKERLALAAMAAYTAAMEGVADHTLRACPPLSDTYAKSIRQLLDTVTIPLDVADIQRLHKQFIVTIADFGEKAAQDYESITNDIREMLGIAVSATDSMQAQSKRDSTNISEFASHIETISTVESVGELRGLLRAEVQHMHVCLEKMAQDDAIIIARLQGEMKALRTKLTEAEKLAFTDPLTGLANRPMLERLATERINSNRPFCTIFFELHQLNKIKESHGLPGADAVLVEFGRRLADSIRATDVACRWGINEFVILLDCQIRDALSRSRHIHSKVSGVYHLSLNNVEIRIEIGCTLGVAENRRGEGLHQLLARCNAPFSAQKPA